MSSDILLPILSLGPLKETKMAQTKFLIMGATGGEVDLQIVDRYLPAVVSNEWLDPAPTEAILRDAHRTVATFEAILGTGAFLAGGQFSLANIALACLIDNLMELPDARLIVPEGAAVRDCVIAFARAKYFWLQGRKLVCCLAFLQSLSPQSA
jgi:glutathione S-transferase